MLPTSMRTVFDIARLTVETVEPPHVANVVDLAAEVLDYWAREVAARGEAGTKAEGRPARPGRPGQFVTNASRRRP